MKRTIKIGRREVRSGILGSLAALLVPLLFWLAPAQLEDVLEQPVIDSIASLQPPQSSDRIAVVDIDSASLDAFEGRRLSRLRLAELIERLTAQQAEVIALDLVLEAPCDIDDPGIARLVDSIGNTNTSSGFLLTQIPTEPPPALSPIAIDAQARFPDGWQAFGAETSCVPLLDAAKGLSTLSLAGDFDALVRSAPAVITVADRPYPSLAVDAVRLHQKTGAIFLLGNPRRLQVGPLQAPLDNGANVKLRFSTPEQQAARTVSAQQLLAGTADSNLFAGKIVFIGSSAAELGGLRPVPGNPVKPSVQIQADFATNLLHGSALSVPDWVRPVTIFLACALGMLFAFAVAMIRPPIALGLAVVTLVGWMAVCVVAYHTANIVLDPVLPVLTMLAGAFASSAIQFSAVRKGEAVIRQRFEQRLPAAVVNQLVSEPDLLKLRGDQRIATSMFTDVEGFTTMTERVSPVDLIELLDRYFEGLTGIIIAHGGMIDKTIGDGIHAMFNAPVDLDRHVDEAIACALEIQAFADSYRNTGLAAESGFGRTRIGIETGSVVLGDVGGSGRVDYASFGSSVNAAARLQDANKQLGTSILIGPGARARATRTSLRDVGEIELRGIGTVRAYTVGE